MKNVIKRILTLCLIACIALGAASCSGKSPENEIKVVSAYNTLKVMQTGDFPDLGRSMEVLMVKGETESGQLIVTPEKDVKDLSLNVSELKMKENAAVTFPTEQIRVYFQKYIYVSVKTAGNQNENYPAGYIPDMLLPQEQAKEYNENSVKGGQNQGLTIEFTTTAETPAGEYAGEFTLVADGREFAVPVKLVVYDITLTGINGMTCMVAGAQYSMSGEYDTTAESYRTYYETAMNEYKFNFEFLPDSLDPEKMAESAIYYWDNPNFTSFNIPNSTYSSGNFDIANQLKLGELYEYFSALAQKSEPGRVLFDKAYIYFKHTDEATSSKYGVVQKAMQDVYDLQEKLLNDLENAGYFDGYGEDYRAEFESSLKGIPLILTGDMTQAVSLGDSVNTYCVRIDSLNVPYERELFENIKSENGDIGGQTWFYTCMEPVYPMPSHHIDDMLLGSRVMRWMQKDWDLDGYLYWQTFSYSRWTGSETVTLDPYTDPVRFPNTNGDGYLAYPGKKYGLDCFLPSVRMLSFRDGQEDYDVLCKFEEILDEKAAFYGIDAKEVSSSLYLSGLYESLYTGAVVNDDDANFYRVRRELLELAVKHSSDTKFLATATVNGATAQSSLYLAEGYGLKVNGKTLEGEVCGGGRKYAVSQQLDEAAFLDVEILKDGEVVETHEIFVSGKTAQIALEDETSVYTSEGSEVSHVGGSAVATIRCQGDDFKEMTVFTPYLGISREVFGGVGLDELEKAEFTIKNTSEYEIDFTVRFKSAYSSYDLGSYTLAAGENKTIVIEQIYSYAGEFSSLGSSAVELCFDNFYIDKNGEYLKFEDREVELSSFYYTLRGRIET